MSSIVNYDTSERWDGSAYICVCVVNPEALDFRSTPELQNDFRTLEGVKYLFQVRLGSHFLYMSQVCKDKRLC
jgi:hypothetical protein